MGIKVKVKKNTKKADYNENKEESSGKNMEEFEETGKTT